MEKESFASSLVNDSFSILLLGGTPMNLRQELQ